VLLCISNVLLARARTAVAGGLYAGAKCAAKDMRQTDDSLNAVAGGALAGAALGLNGMRWTNVLTRRL
jgi:hypothetical protein